MPSGTADKYWRTDGQHACEVGRYKRADTKCTLEDAREICVQEGYGGFTAYPVPFSSKKACKFIQMSKTDIEANKRLDPMGMLYTFDRALFLGRLETIPRVSKARDTGASVTFQDVLEGVGKMTARAFADAATGGLAELAEGAEITAEFLANVQEGATGLGQDVAMEICGHGGICEIVNEGYELCDAGSLEEYLEGEFEQRVEGFQEDVEDKLKEQMKKLLRRGLVQVTTPPTPGKYYTFMQESSGQFLCHSSYHAGVATAVVSGEDPHSPNNAWVLVPVQGTTGTFCIFNSKYAHYLEVAGGSKSSGAFVNPTSADNGGKRGCQFNLWKVADTDHTYTIMNTHSKHFLTSVGGKLTQGSNPRSKKAHFIIRPAK